MYDLLTGILSQYLLLGEFCCEAFLDELPFVMGVEAPVGVEAPLRVDWRRGVLVKDIRVWEAPSGRKNCSRNSVFVRPLAEKYIRYI